MCRIFDSHSPRGFVPAAEPVRTHASFIRFLLCILISSRLRAGLRIRLYRLCRRTIQVLPAASFPKAPGKSVFLFVFSCFGAHEIKVRGQYFFDFWRCLSTYVIFTYYLSLLYPKRFPVSIFSAKVVVFLQKWSILCPSGFHDHKKSSASFIPAELPVLSKEARLYITHIYAYYSHLQSCHFCHISQSGGSPLLPQKYRLYRKL